MKLKKNYQLKINLPDTVNIEKNKETLFISGPLGFTELNLKKLDSSGIGAIKLEEALIINENKNFILQAKPVEKNKIYLKSPHGSAHCPAGLKNEVFRKNSRKDGSDLFLAENQVFKGKHDTGMTKKLLFFSTNSKSFFGCVSSIIQNKIYGVTRGFLIYMRIIGVGYRAQLQGAENQMLYLKVGFSHDIKFEVPRAVRVFLLEPTLICLYGIDKNQVTQTASKIKKIKLPSVYKGKGIRLVNDKIVLKAGKKR
jgi:large subunit ribosomal protein L6